MVQKNIREFDNDDYSIAEGAEIVKELNDRTRSEVEAFNNIDLLAQGVKKLTDAANLKNTNIPVHLISINYDFESDEYVNRKIVNAINARPKQKIKPGYAVIFFSQRAVLDGSGGGTGQYVFYKELFKLAKEIPVTNDGFAYFGVGTPPLNDFDIIQEAPIDSRKLEPQNIDLGDIGATAIHTKVNSLPAQYATPNGGFTVFKAKQNDLDREWLFVGRQESVGSGNNATIAADYRLLTPANIDQAPNTITKKWHEQVSMDISCQSTFEESATEAKLAKIGNKIFRVFRYSALELHSGNEGNPYLQKSTDNGKTWGDKALVFDGPYDNRNYSFQNINGKLFLFFRKYDAVTIDMGYIFSEDEGVAWSAFISVSDKFTLDIAAPFGRLFTDGTKWYAPFYNTGLCQLLESSDDGTTWVFSSTVYDLTPQKIGEPFFTHLGNGKIIALLRTDDAGVQPFYQITSSDNGANWTAPVATNHNEGKDLRTAPFIWYDAIDDVIYSIATQRKSDRNQDILLYANKPDEVFNDPTAYRLISKQKGHWQASELYGYPDIVRTGDDQFLITYTEKHRYFKTGSEVLHEKANIFQFYINKNIGNIEIAPTIDERYRVRSAQGLLESRYFDKYDFNEDVLFEINKKDIDKWNAASLTSNTFQGEANFLSANKDLWESGYYLTTDPTKTDDGRYIRIKNIILVKSNSNYTVALDFRYTMIEYNSNHVGVAFFEKTSADSHFTFKTQPTTAYVLIYLRNAAKTAITVDVLDGKKFKLERGNVATDWTPSIFDYLPKIAGKTDADVALLGGGSKPLSEFATNLSITNTALTLLQSASELNTLYPSALDGFAVKCPNVNNNGVGKIYIKTGVTGQWMEIRVDTMLNTEV